jgi:CSLREA domain-containing protein
MIGTVFYQVGEDYQATAATSPPTAEGTILVTTLDDELNKDGDCSLRGAIKAGNDNIPVYACPAGNVVIIDTITFDAEGTITVTSHQDKSCL